MRSSVPGLPRGIWEVLVLLATSVGGCEPGWSSATLKTGVDKASDGDDETPGGSVGKSNTTWLVDGAHGCVRGVVLAVF